MTMHLDSKGSQKRTRVMTEALLLIALVGFLGTYLWTSYRGERVQTPVQEKLLTYHDDLLDIHKGSNGQAWIVGKNGLILHTTDEGRTWRQQVSNSSQTLLGISFAQNQRVGYAVGNGGIILTTKDSGDSWDVRTYEAIGKPQPVSSLLAVQAVDETKAYAVGAFGTFLSTSDGGKNWTRCIFSWEKLIPRFAQTEPNLNALYFVSEKIGWVAGEFGLILHTRDGGRTWISQRNGSNLPQLFAIIFLDERRGWAMGQRGSFIMTRDGGENWLPCNIDTDKDLYAASCDRGSVVAVGNRIFLKKEDGSYTFAKKDFGENLVLNGVALMSKVATVVGQGGVIRQINY